MRWSQGCSWVKCLSTISLPVASRAMPESGVLLFLAWCSLVVEVTTHGCVFQSSNGIRPARGDICAMCWQFGLQQAVRPRKWASAHHRDGCAFLCHRWYESHRGCTATDNNHFLTRVIKIFWPKLRVNHLTFECVLARELGSVRLIVVVVAAAHLNKKSPVTTDSVLSFSWLVTAQLACLAIPGGIQHLMAKADMLTNSKFVCSLIHVLPDRRAIGNGFGLGPGLKLYPSVCMSESDRMPGYRNKSQVPPRVSRPSSSVKVFPGHFCRK